jgi:hypothetical protein
VTNNSAKSATNNSETYSQGHTQAEINKEIFAYFLQKKSGALTIPFLQAIEGKIWGLLPDHDIKDEMDDIFNNGHP